MEIFAGAPRKRPGMRKSDAGLTEGRKVVLARVAGFCFGVRRAVDVALQTRHERSGPVSVLGALVHNEQVNRGLRDRGVDRADSLSQIRAGAVVISAHGASPAVRRDAVERGLSVVDVTCPFVTRVHKCARQLYAEGRQVVILGDPAHTEVRGIIGAVEELGGAVTVVSGPEQAAQITLSGRVGLVSQTTQRATQFEATAATLAARCGDLRAINTICGATDELQAAAIELARHVEAVIVIGGRQSANTARLLALCLEQGCPAWQVESASELDDSWLAGRRIIGITAGASTPDSAIEAVARRLNGGRLPRDWSLKHPD